MLTIIRAVGSVNIFRLIVNPNHFGQSVENLFILSGLFGDGLCGFRISDNGEPIVCACIGAYVIICLIHSRCPFAVCTTGPTTSLNRPTDGLGVRYGNVVGTLTSTKLCMSLMHSHKNAIDMFEIRETMMAHRPPCVY